jgi:hypothetical protein
VATPGVTAFLKTLVHRRKDEIERLRAIILAADPTLGEQIKWNAPSFGRDGEDRVTFRLQPGDRVELILHRGAKVKAGPFAFDDKTGLIEWLAADRGRITFAGMADIEAKADTLQALVADWIAVTID